MRKRWTAALILLLTAVTVFGNGFRIAAAEDQTDYYAENEWNYVDDSMNTKNGIPADAAGVMGRVERNGVLRVAVDPYHAPQIFLDPEQTGEGRYAGVDIRLARLIAERMGVSLKIIELESTLILPSLTENQCDLAISAVSFTPSRGLSYTMSKAYYYPDITASIGMILRKENRETITSLEDLKGRIIIAESSSLPEALAAKHVSSYLEFRRALSAQAVYDAVVQGKAAAGFVNISGAELYLQLHPDSDLCLADGLSWLPDAQFLGDRVAAKKGETQLIAFVNGVIDEALENGAMEGWIREARKRAAELGVYGNRTKKTDR